MGHRKSLTRQVQEALTEKCAFGESRHAGKKDGTSSDKIYSYDTLKTYLKAAIRFTNYCKEKHGCKYLEECKPHVAEYLSSLRGSASTVKMESSALSKLFGVQITSRDDRTNGGRYRNPWNIELPVRNRDDFTRTRGQKERDKGFSEKNNSELIMFCCCVGPRHYKELTQIRGTDLRETDNSWKVSIKGKGGRPRLAPIVGSKEEVSRVVEMMRNAGDKKVWPKVNTHADIHSYRSEYAMRIYRQYARTAEELKGQRWFNPARRCTENAAYIFRKGALRGTVIDKSAALKAAQALTLKQQYYHIEI